MKCVIVETRLVAAFRLETVLFCPTIILLLECAKWFVWEFEYGRCSDWGIFEYNYYNF